MTAISGPVCEPWEPGSGLLCEHNSCWNIMCLGDGNHGGWWLATLGIAAYMTPADVAAQLASYDGPNEYQARAELPDGAVIVAGVHGASPGHARADIAGLFRVPITHWAITEITPRAQRSATITETKGDT